MILFINFYVIFLMFEFSMGPGFFWIPFSFGYHFHKFFHYIIIDIQKSYKVLLNLFRQQKSSKTPGV